MNILLRAIGVGIGPDPSVDKPHILYAMPHSLYLLGACPQLSHQKPYSFRGTFNGTREFQRAEVLPKSKLPTIPTLVTTEGEVIRDEIAAIIEHFEAASGRPCQPAGARQQVISALFDVIGTDGLLRPAMHYRWNFPDDNLAFVRYHFLYSQRDVPEREEKTEAMMNRMRYAAMIFGVTEQSQPVVEALYLDYLDALNRTSNTTPIFWAGAPALVTSACWHHVCPFRARSVSRATHATARPRYTGG